MSSCAITKLFQTDEFIVTKIQGDANTPFCTYSVNKGNGQAADDCISIANKPFRLNTFTESYDVPAWTDGGKIAKHAGGWTIIFNEPFTYWCVSPVNRNGLNKFTGTIFTFNNIEQKNIQVNTGDFLVLLEGRAFINKVDTRQGSVINSRGPDMISVESKSSSVLLRVSQIKQ